ncbi:MAG TPA: PA14 domain-containing protein, partial [Verrucomicrobiae bacterium]|nr:PA14 domain-containing protein [Verrucomicrobiae bacterium]
MKYLYRRGAIVAAAGAVFALLSVPVFGQTSNGVLREVYLNIGGNAISDLTSSPNFPNNPSYETIEQIFEAPSDVAESYGQRMRALLIAPTTGSYIFWIASDDNGALYLSTDDQPGHKVQIATVNTWTSSREWTKEPNQQSAPITLQAGQRYYIEALQKEGGGGDNLAVGWQLPDTTLERPIPNNRVLIYGLGPPIITQQPANVTVFEGGSASFSVALSHMIGATFQWLRNGTNVPNATNSSIVLPGPLTLGDNSSRFSCFIANPYGTTNSTEAVLTVLADTTRPTIS